VKLLFPLGGILLLCALVLEAACESSPPEAEPPPPAAAAAPALLPLGTFSSQRAFDDVVALADLRARAAPGSNAELRTYVGTQLAATTLAVETVTTPDAQGAAAGVGEARSWTQVIATAPGALPDLFVLVARLGESGPAASGEALREEVSGAALLLELARVLSTRSLPYTTRFVWIDGDRHATPLPDVGANADASGSAALAALWASDGDLSRVRLLVAFERVCRDDLHIARDLGSSRVHREDFFEAAGRTGWVHVFPRNQEYESVEASHLSFRAAGVRPVVAVTGASADPLDGHTCVSQSLEAVGTVALDALGSIGSRLAKIDRFSRAPLSKSGDAAPADASAAQPEGATPYGPEPAHP
jgi:hypothetical protein